MALTKRPICADTLSDVDDVSDERDAEAVAAEQPADFADELDQLAVVEAELAAAEAELEGLEDAPASIDAGDSDAAS